MVKATALSCAFFPALFSVVFGFCICLSAVPEVSRAIIKVGMSPRLKPYSAATLTCLISNPDQTGHKVSLRLIPSDSMFSGSLNVYTDVVDIPAKTSMTYSSTVIIDNSENYKLEIFSDGSRLAQSESILVKIHSGRSVQIGVLNDSIDASFGSFTLLPEFKDKLIANHFTAVNFPDDYALLKKFGVIVVIEPDFNRFKEGSYRALCDYVARGGILVFAYPGAIRKAAETPMAELLPVVPVKIRPVDDRSFLKAYVPDFPNPKKKMDFLESYAVKGSNVYLKNGDFPVFVWKNYGLGSVRFSAVSLCEDAYGGDKESWTALMKIFFSGQHLCDEPDSFMGALDEMTGFSIPAPGLIIQMLAIYFAVVLLIFTGGILLRKHGEAWCLSVLFSLIMTFFVIAKSREFAKSTGSLFTEIGLEILSPVSSPSENFYGMFSTNDSKMTVKCRTASGLLTNFLPPEGMYMMMPGFFGSGASNKKSSLFGGGGDTYSAPAADSDQKRNTLLVDRENGLQALKDLELKALASRQFTSFMTSESLSRSPIDSYPVMNYSASGFELEPWTIPPGMDVSHAAISFADGLLPLMVNGGKVTYNPAADASIFSSDTLQARIIEAMRSGFRPANPAILLIGKLKGSELEIPATMKVQGRNLFLVPLVENYPGGRISLLPEQIVFAAGDSSSRMMLRGNSIRVNQANVIGSNISFNFELPSGYFCFSPDEIAVDFTYNNPGGNVIAEPVLVKVGDRGGSSDKKPNADSSKGGNTNVKTDLGQLAGKKVSEGRFVFSGREVGKCIDPLTGSGKLILDIRERNAIMDQIQKSRANSWSIVSLRISMKGNFSDKVSLNID